MILISNLKAIQPKNKNSEERICAELLDNNNTALKKQNGEIMATLNAGSYYPNFTLFSEDLSEGIDSEMQEVKPTHRKTN